MDVPKVDLPRDHKYFEAESARLDGAIDIKSMNERILSEHSDYAYMICKRYQSEFDCWTYDPSARRLTIDLGLLEGYDSDWQDHEALVVFQHIHLGLVDDLVILRYVERRFRHGSKYCYFDDVVNIENCREFLSVIEFEKIKSVKYVDTAPEV